MTTTGNFSSNTQPISVGPTDSTMPDLWCDRRIRIRVEGPKGSLLHTTRTPFALIGTHPAAELTLTGKNIHRRHVFALATHSGVFVVNLDPHAPKVTGQWAKSDEPINVGPLKVYFGLDAEISLTCNQDSLLFKEHKRQEQNCRVEFRVRDSKLGSSRIPRRLSIFGKHKSCTFPLNNPRLSPFHAAFFQHQGRVWVIDLESSSRTVLDGRPIRVAEAVADKPFRTGIVKIVFTNCGNAHRTSDPAVSTAMQNQADHSATATIIDLDTDAPDNNTASTNQLLQRVAQLDQREAAIEQTQNELSTQAEELAARSTALDALADSLDDKKRSLESLEQKLQDRERKLAAEQLQRVELQDTLEETRKSSGDSG